MSKKEALKAGARWFKNLLKPESAGKATLAYKDDAIKSIKPSKGKAGTARYLEKTHKARTESKMEGELARDKERWDKINKKLPHDLSYMKGQLKD